MEMFTNCCIILVGLVCVESCTASFICKQSGPLSPFLVSLSVVFSSFSTSFVSFRSFFYGGGKHDLRKVSLYRYESRDEQGEDHDTPQTNYFNSGECEFDMDATVNPREEEDVNVDFEVVKETETESRRMVRLMNFTTSS